MSRTVSTRLENYIYDRIITRCKQKGITVNEFLKECIQIRFDNSELTPKLDEISKPVQQKLSEKDLAIILGISTN